jgi:hypothetical protein
MSEVTRTTTGVAIQLGDKYWGVEYADGHSTSCGWVSLDQAYISDPRYLTKPEQATYEGSRHVEELRKGVLVKVVRTVTTQTVEP